MLLLIIACMAHAFVLPAPLPASEAAGGSPGPSDEAANTQLSWIEATVLGLVEGITEFLPISSTGHLVLTNHVFGLDDEAQARDRAGAPLWLSPARSGETGAGEIFTIKDAADTYAVVIQAGAIAAVALLYWRTLLVIAAGVIGRNPGGLRLLRNLLIAFLPAVILGLAFEDFIDEQLFSVRAVVAALIAGALLMLVVSRWQRKKSEAAGNALPDLALAELTPGQSLAIGLLQCVALWPGMSRSMMTIVGGYLVGLRPARAAEFSFLLGLPTLGGAAAYKALKTGGPMLEAFGVAPVLWGCVVAAVSAGLAVRWLVFYLNRHGLAVFAWYRLALAAVVVALL